MTYVSAAFLDAEFLVGHRPITGTSNIYVKL